MAEFPPARAPALTLALDHCKYFVKKNWQLGRPDIEFGNAPRSVSALEMIAGNF